MRPSWGPGPVVCREAASWLNRALRGGTSHRPQGPGAVRHGASVLKWPGVGLRQPPKPGLARPRRGPELHLEVRDVTSLVRALIRVNEAY